MNYINNKYKYRLVDEKIKKYLKYFNCILIEGPKWCGKSWTSINSSNEQIFLSDLNTRKRVSNDINFIYKINKTPLLIDEWQNVPEIWDSIRNRIDLQIDNNKYILTGSTSFNAIKKNNSDIFHSGTGRIARIKMYTMSTYEFGESDGLASIKDMYNNLDISCTVNSCTISKIAIMLVRGGWPSSLSIEFDNEYNIISKTYFESLIQNDIKELGAKSSNYIRMLLKSLARNESTLVSERTILRDISELENENEISIARNTLSKYLDVLRDLFILVEEEPFDINYRSSKKVGKSKKKHLIDPSLSCVALNLNHKNILNDMNTFGFLFESLIIRDLRIYADSLNAKLYYFRDNSSGDEIDAIIEFEDGEYATFEVKLSMNGFDEAKKSLVKFKNAVNKKPKFSCIVLGLSDSIFYNKEENIYCVPFTSLKP